MQELKELFKKKGVISSGRFNLDYSADLLNNNLNISIRINPTVPSSLDQDFKRNKQNQVKEALERLGGQYTLELTGPENGKLTYTIIALDEANTPMEIELNSQLRDPNQSANWLIDYFIKFAETRPDKF